MAIPVIAEILEISFHHILYIKKVYPKMSFEMKKINEIPLWKSLHPEICAYIKRFLMMLKLVLEYLTSIEAVITIKGPTGTCLEEFVFRIADVKGNSNARIEESSLKDVLTGLSHSVSSVDSTASQKGEKFELQIRLPTPSLPRLSRIDVISELNSEVFPWNKLINSVRKRSVVWSQITPLKSTTTFGCKMQIYVYQTDY